MVSQFRGVIPSFGKLRAPLSLEHVHPGPDFLQKPSLKPQSLESQPTGSIVFSSLGLELINTAHSHLPIGSAVWVW